MIFKTIISDINKVALAMDSLKNISQFNTGSTIVNGMALSESAIISYKTAIDGLSLSQAQAALSSTALTDAQKEQILVSAGLLQSTQATTLEEVKQMASSASLSAQKKEEILTTLQGAYSENEWNMERLEAIAASGGEAGAIAESILAKKTENAENIKGVASSKALTASLWEQLKARLALLAANPVAWIAGVAAVSVGLIALQKKLTKSLDECTEELSNFNSEVENAQSEADSLQTEWETCQKRLGELQKLADNGTISIIEQEEYERLLKTNDELERNIRIQKEKAQLSAMNAANSADETLSKTVESKYKTSWQDYTGMGVATEQASWITPEEELNAAIEEYNRLQTAIDRLKVSYDKGNISAEEYNTQLTDLTNQQTDARNRASEMSDILVESEQAYTNLTNTGAELTTTQTANYNSVKQANAAYNDFLGTINGVDSAFENLDTTEKAQSLKNKYAAKKVSLPKGQGSYTVEDKEISDWIDTLSDEDLTVLASINFSGEQTKDSMQEALDYAKNNVDGNIDETDILSFSDAWEKLKNSTEDATKGLADDLIELAESGKLTVEALSEADSTGYFENLGISADEAVQKINSMVDSATQLQSMSAQISKMSDMLADKKNGTVASADDLASFDVEVRGLDSWDRFERVMMSSTSSMDECQAAANSLASEWINNGNYLANLTEETKQSYITQLEMMGVENAHIIVLENLAKAGYELSDAEQAELDKAIQAREEIYALQVAEAKDFIAKKDLKAAAEDAYVGLIKEAEGAGISKAALFDLIYQQNIFSNQKLNIYDKIAALQELGEAFGITADAALGASQAINLKNQLRLVKHYGGSDADVEAYYANIESQYQDAIKSKFANLSTTISPSGSSGYTPPKTKNGSDSKDTKQTIDWISRLLDVLQKKIDATKAKFDNLFTLKDKKNNLAEQITLTKGLLTATTVAAERYKKAANKVGLPKELKAKVQNGSYDITEYGSKTAEKIQKYQEYIDRYDELKQQEEELNAEIRNLKIEKKQLYVDDADARKDLIDSEIELVTSGKNKNKLEKDKIKYIKQSYNKQIEIAEIEKDSVKVSQLRIDKEKELLAVKKEILQNTLDQNDKEMELLDAKYQNASTVKEKNKILDKKDTISGKNVEAYRTNYKDAKKNVTSSGKTVASSTNSAKSLSDSDRKKINSYVNKGKKVPDSLLKKVKVVDKEWYDLLVQYNSKYTTDYSSVVNAIKKSKVSQKTQDSLEKAVSAGKSISKTTLENVKKKDTSLYKKLSDWNKRQQDRADIVSTISSTKTLTSSDKKKIKSLVDAEKPITDSLLQKVASANPSLYAELVDYNNKLDYLDESEYNLDVAKEQDKTDKANNAKEQFDNLKSQYENRISILNSKAESLNGQMEMVEARGYVVNGDYYNKLIKNTQSNLSELSGELVDLRQKRDEMLKDGTLKKGSDDWYEIQNAIWSVKNAQDEAVKSIIEYQKQIRQLKWDAFDRQEDFISKIQDEGNFLIDLMSNEKLFYDDFQTELKEYQKGGNVNLLLRPQIDSSELNKIGWDAGNGISTVFTSTYSNEDGTIALNFTPIIADPKTGEYIGALSPSELQSYAESVIAGTREDDLNLQIGSSFNGSNAIDQAVKAAEEIHELQQKYYLESESIGNWTEYANAISGLRAMNYNAYMAQADDYEKEIQAIQQEINNDPYNIDLIQRKQELISTQRELIKSAEQEKESIKSLVSDGYNKWLDALQKSIDLRKKELDSVSDLYTYQKNIAKLAKETANYEKQWLALQGDDSEENKATLQKVTVALQDSRDALQESEYEQWKTDQQKMLDVLADDAQEWVNQRLDNIDGLISDVISATNTNSTAIKNTLEKVTSDVGITLSSDMTKIWNSTDGISSVVSEYGKSFNENLTSVGSTLTEIKGYVEKISNAPVQSDTDKDDVESGTGSDTGKDDSFSMDQILKNIKATTFIESNSVKPKNDPKSYSPLNQYIYEKTGKVLPENKQGELASILGITGIGTDTNATDRAKILKALKDARFSKGGTIGKTIKSMGENGVILARTGEEVLSLEKIDKLKETLKLVNPTPNIKPFEPLNIPVRTQNVGNNIDKVEMEINLPNVTNYEEFKSNLIKDRQFEKVIQTMTLGNALGGNTLNKYRIR